MSDQILKLIQETNTLIHEQRKSYDEAEKNNATQSGELKEKQEKLYSDFEATTKKIEEIEKNQAKIQKNMDILESFQNASPVEKNDLSKRAEMYNALREWASRSGEGSGNFVSRAKELNLISTDSNPDGGYAVIPQIEAIKTARFFETSDVRTVADVRRTSSNSISIPIDEDEATSTKSAERSAASNTATPELKDVEIFVQKYDAEPTVTHESLQDMYFDVESWLNRKAFDKISRSQNTDFVTGTGKTRGILSYSAWTTENTYEHGKVEQLAGSTSGGFSADEIIKLVGKLKSVYVNANTRMAMNRRTFFEHLLLKKNGYGDYLFLDTLKEAISGMRFLGIQIAMWDDMPVPASNALSIAVGDFKEGYTIVDKPGILFIRDMYTDKSRIKLYTSVRTGAGVANFEAFKILKCGA
jgi:HK97 family phage major capsid protein